MYPPASLSRRDPRGSGIRWIGLAILLSVAAATHAGEPVESGTLSAAELQARLATLRRDIASFTEALEASKTERSQIENELKRSETEIGDLVKRIDRIEKDLAERGRNLAALQQRQRELLTAREEQQGYIAQQIRAAYKVGRQEYVKVLLNQEDPSQVSRMLKYYDYFNRARAEQVARYTDTLTSLRQVEIGIERETEILRADRAQLRDRRQALEASRKEREVTLARLNATIADHDAQIRKLTTDREHLEELLDRITRSITDLPTPVSLVPFASRKGAMDLPVAGRIANRFGTPNIGRVRWNGIFIEAATGEPVHAVHYGRIVFSDWLRGFGLLVIIDHGDGYMSLYGHNQTIYRETGDWVQAGDVIATAGNSGGLDRSGLYFEIRVAGKPTDPQPWLKGALARNP